MNHLPVQRWWTPDEFNELKTLGETLGIPHVESSPLTRSSYHAKEAETLAKNKANSLTTSGSK
jgi:lipoic acid synthetase